MSGNRPIEFTDIMAAIGDLKAELRDWGRVNDLILSALEVHTRLLMAISEAVERQPAEESDPLADLLRQLVGNGKAHTAGLQRIESEIAAFTKAVGD